MEKDNLQCSVLPSAGDKEKGDENGGKPVDSTVKDDARGSISPSAGNNEGGNGEGGEGSAETSAGAPDRPPSRRPATQLTAQDLLLLAVAQSAGHLARIEAINSGELPATAEERATLNQPASNLIHLNAPFTAALTLVSITKEPNPKSGLHESTSAISQALIDAYDQLSSGLTAFFLALIDDRLSPDVAPYLAIAASTGSDLANLAMAVAYSAAAYADLSLPITLGGMALAGGNGNGNDNGGAVCSKKAADSPPPVVAGHQVADLPTVIRWLTEALGKQAEKLRQAASVQAASIQLQQQMMAMMGMMVNQGDVASGPEVSTVRRSLKRPRQVSSSSVPKLPGKRSRTHPPRSMVPKAVGKRTRPRKNPPKDVPEDDSGTRSRPPRSLHPLPEPEPEQK